MIWEVSILRGERAESCENLVRVVGVEQKSKEPAGTVKEVEEVSGGRVREGRSKLPEEEQQTDEAARSSGP